MASKKTDLTTAPLSTAAQYILLALAGEDLHGYGIVQQVPKLSGGSYSLGPGTLYDNLKKLMNAGLVTDTPSGANKEDDRRTYRITPEGHRTLSAEMQRLENLVIVHARLRRLGNA